MYNPVTVRAADGKPFAKENSFALLAGVGKRSADSGQMQVTATDADTIRKALVKAYDLFDEKNVTTLLNSTASTSNIYGALDELVQNTATRKADLIIIYFSGHGYVRQGKYFLIANDTTALKQEDAAVDAADFAAKTNAIEATVFADKLKRIECNKMLVLLDCCHAAGINIKPFDEDVFKDCPNRVIITACGKGQVSYLSQPVSIFTYALIEALGGKFLTGTDSVVTIFSLGMAVSARVAALSSLVLNSNAEPQKPEMDVLENSQTFNYPIARYPKGGPQEIRLLKEEIKSLSTADGTKEIAVENVSTAIPDEAFRQRFKWLENKFSISTEINVSGNNNMVQNTSLATQQNGNNNNSYAAGGNIYVAGDRVKTKAELKREIWDVINTWKTSFKDDDERGLERQINEINKQIDNLENR